MIPPIDATIDLFSDVIKVAFEDDGIKFEPTLDKLLEPQEEAHEQSKELESLERVFSAVFTWPYLCGFVERDD